MKNVSVIGAGTMGNGIAHVFAQSGFNVTLVDVNPTQVERALATIAKNMDRQVAKGTLTEEAKAAALARIQTSNELSTGVKEAELVVEAATENVQLKLEIFKSLDLFAPKGCILASNTSSLSISAMGAQLKHPQRIIGVHFFNPAPLMRLVEIIPGLQTEPTVLERARKLIDGWGKTTVIAKDTPSLS